MGLRNIKLATYTLMVGEEPVVLRGVSLSDLMILADTYGPALTIAFNKVQSGMADAKDTRQLIHMIAKEFPQVVAAGIALSADDYNEEGVEIAGKLPFQLQVEAIEQIFRLTFTSEAEVKKLMGSLTQMMTQVSGALTTIRLPSGTGIGESDAA